MWIKNEQSLNDLLFWLHVALVLSMILAGFVLSPTLMIILVVLHRAHMLMFNGCAFSKIQKHFGGLPEDVKFLQLAIKRIFKKSISLRQSYVIDGLLTIFAVAISFFHG